MKVSFYLESPKGTKRNPTGENETAIFARICYEGYKVKYYTPENILPKYWNEKAKPHRAKETAKFPTYPEFNKRLDNIEAAIKNTIRKYANDNDNKTPFPAILKPLLDIAIKNGGKIKQDTFMSFFDRFMTDSRNGTRLTKKGKPVTPGTIKSYDTTKVILEAYQTHYKKTVDFANIDMEFYSSFTKYLTLVKKQSTNYIGKHIKVIKTVLTYAKENFDIAVNNSFEKSIFKTISEQVDSIYLAEWEIKQIKDLDLSDNLAYDRVRDLFIVGCYTGLRFGDLSGLTAAKIKDGFIHTRQIKTGGGVIIPVHDIVTEMLNKYGGEFPKALSNQKANEYLKVIGGKTEALKSMVSNTATRGGKEKKTTVQKSELLTTHTGRRSFCTNEYLAGTEPSLIMAISGHRTEAAFLKYVKVQRTDRAQMFKNIQDKRKVEKSKTIAI